LLSRTARVLGLALALCAGCGSKGPLPLAADSSSYYVSGYYIGSMENVKLFVESLVFVSDQRGLVAVDIAILNERPTAVTFLSAKNSLTVGGSTIGNLETLGMTVKPGELGRTTLRFRTALLSFSSATISIDGIQIALGTQLHFDVAIHAVDPEAPSQPEPHVGSGMRSH
jgi:hypothetical protein